MEYFSETLGLDMSIVIDEISPVSMSECDVGITVLVECFNLFLIGGENCDR